MKTNKLRFIAATNNAHKLREIQEILASVGCECVGAADAGVNVEPVEDGATFAENAYIKAKAFVNASLQPAVADDSGLCVDALDGAPGLFTARFAGEGCTNEQNIDKLLTALADVPMGKRQARFISSVCALFPDGRRVCAVGVVEGYIGFERQGEGGFGYDPIFRLPNNMPIAMLSESAKNAISHRGRALRKLAFKLRGITRMKGFN